MTAPEHWRRASDALAPDGALTLLESIRSRTADALMLAGAAPGLDHLCRTAGTLDRAVRGIQSARYLVGLGCPKPMGRHTVLDPMERP